MRSQAVGTPIIKLPTASANPYQPLADYLNQRWQQGSKLSIEIGCGPRGDGLVVLVEHAIAVQPNLFKTFGCIKDFLESAPEEVWTAHPAFGAPPKQLVVKLFIRVAGQAQTYGEDEYEVVPLRQFPGQFAEEPDSKPSQPGNGSARPPASVRRIPAPPPPPSALALVTPDLAADSAGAEQASLEQARQEGDQDNQDNAEAEPLGPEILGDGTMDPEMAAAFTPEHLRLEPLTTEEATSQPPAGHPPSDNSRRHYSQVDTPEANPYEANPYETEQYEADPYETEQYEAEEPIREHLHIPRSVWAAGLGLCLMTFSGSFYVASRPCWFRSCPSLALAQQQGQAANDRLLVASTWNDIEQARQELNAALKELRSVPSWTTYGQQARGLRTRYRKVLKSLEPMQDGLKQAEIAQDKSQSSLLKVKQWEEVQVYWEAAIAQLKGVSPQSPMYALAQDKLNQYEKNLTTVQTRLGDEASGQQLLSEARSLAMGSAKSKDDDQDSLEFLQRTQVRLEDALYTLRQVPRGTTAYQEAVQLMSRYESELSINQGQQSKEEFIIDSYRAALSDAEAAKVSEIQDRWDDALAQWQSAIASIRQIPSSSSYFDKAQGLASEYAYALQQAETKAEQYAALRRVEQDLDEICAGSPQVCNYEVTSQLIAVTLTLEYERAVLTAGAVGDEQSRIGALNHVHALETALEEISNEAQIPLDLYDPDGIMVGTHQPRTSVGAI